MNLNLLRISCCKTAGYACLTMWTVLWWVAMPALAQKPPDLPRVRRTIEYLASPRLHGRGYVRRGERKAAAYLRRRFQQLGLRPCAPKYTQSFTLDVNTFPGQLALQRKLKATSANTSWHRLRPGLDFIAAPNSNSGRIGGSAIATPLDTLIFSNSLTQRRWVQQPWGSNGVTMTARDAHRLVGLPRRVQQHLDSAAFVLTIVPKLTASLSATQARQVRLEVRDSVWNQMADQLPAAVKLRVDARLKRQYPTQNLIGCVPGRIQPDSFVVVTAHYDHLGRMGRRTYFPGANDNASGTALLLELAAHYAHPENQPSSTLR